LAVFDGVDAIGADDPSVLTADRVCKILLLQVSQSMDVFDKSKACRKPAPFGKGAKN